MVKWINNLQLECRIIKQECYNRRSNIKFFGVKDADDETPSDTEKKLREFLEKEMQMTSDDLEEINFERVHRIPTHPSGEKNTKKKTQPRPIIANVSFFKDKEFVKSHIKNIPKVKNMVLQTTSPTSLRWKRLEKPYTATQKRKTRKEESLLQHRETSH